MIIESQTAVESCLSLEFWRNSIQQLNSSSVFYGWCLRITFFNALLISLLFINFSLVVLPLMRIFNWNHSSSLFIRTLYNNVVWEQYESVRAKNATNFRENVMKNQIDAVISSIRVQCWQHQWLQICFHLKVFVRFSIREFHCIFHYIFHCPAYCLVNVLQRKSRNFH